MRGELKCRVITDFAKQRFRKGARLFIRGQAHILSGARMQPPHVLLRFEDITDREAAAQLRGADLEVLKSEALELPEGEYFWHEVIGLRVETPAGEALGSVSDIIETGANDVYVVHGERGEILVPAIKDVVKAIDPPAGRMLIEPMPGMLR